MIDFIIDICAEAAEFFVERVINRIIKRGKNKKHG